MRALVPIAVSVIAYLVAGWWARLALTVVTVPFGRREAVTGSRGILNLLRLVVSAACGAVGLATMFALLGVLDVRATPTVAVAVGAVVAAIHLVSARRILGTRQAVDELVSLLGEEAGLAATAFWLLTV